MPVDEVTRRTVNAWWYAALTMLVLCGCMRDPLDPHGELEHRRVRELEGAEQVARSRGAYERARDRLPRVKRRMSIRQVESAMEAVVVIEGGGRDDKEVGLPRQKLIEGYLCSVTPSPLTQRWLFGFDEGGVELVGFAVELERSSPDDDDWEVRTVDRHPADDCTADADDAGRSKEP